MKFNSDIPIFGDTSYRGECPREVSEQANFYAWLKLYHSDYADLFIHPKSEGKRTPSQVNYDRKTGGIPTSMPDCMIIGRVPFCVELKRKDHTKSRWQEGQQEKLIRLADAGCFIGVALGCEGLKEAFLSWLDHIEQN